MRVLRERPITLAEVKQILEEKERDYIRRGSELLYEQKRALDYLRRFAKLPVEEAKKLVEELVGLGLSEEHATKICDLLPETVDDVRAIFGKERFKYAEQDIRRILEVVDKYR